MIWPSYHQSMMAESRTAAAAAKPNLARCRVMFLVCISGNAYHTLHWFLGEMRRKARQGQRAFKVVE
jgi:hypothetical protein